MLKETVVVFKDGLLGHTGKVILLSDGKSAVALDDGPPSSGPACLCCISAGNATMLEEAAKALGAKRLLWLASTSGEQWQGWGREIAARWPQSIKHEFAIPPDYHQCKTQDEFLRLCDKVAARLP